MSGQVAIGSSDASWHQYSITSTSGLVEEVRAFVAEHGPLTVGDLPAQGRRSSSMWAWSQGKRALEYLFWSGAVTARRRPADFARVYDLTERVVPPAVLALPAPEEDEAKRELLLMAARSLGVATLQDLCDYHRINVPRARPLVAALAEEGRLVPVTVEGWDRPAYLHPGAAIPRAARARALLSPFDSLVWFRPRTERLFGFRYRLEIYVPAHKRVHGYYVLPFLLGDRLVARVDLKADRAAGALLVQAAHAEPGAATAATADALAVEASVRYYARLDDADEEFWGCTALLHDFDYEIHPTLDEHPQDGAPILREEGYPEELIEAVLSHAEHLGMPRDTPLKRTLFACDELSGFVHACGLVRPTGLEGLEPKSVRKKLKQPSFAAGVHRDEVYAGAELLGLELDEHIANVIAALQPIAGELGLQTAAV